MAKIKLFHRSKSETQPVKEKEKPQKKHTMVPIRQEQHQTVHSDYNETLYSKDAVQKKTNSTLSEKNQPTRRMSWENTETIEKNIDTINLKQSVYNSDQSQKRIDTERKVDYLLLKKKK